MGKNSMKEFIDEATYSSEVLAYIVANADKLNSVDALIFTTMLIKFGKDAENIYFKLKRENRETRTTEIKFEG